MDSKQSEASDTATKSQIVSDEDLLRTIQTRLDEEIEHWTAQMEIAPEGRQRDMAEEHLARLRAESAADILETQRAELIRDEENKRDRLVRAKNELWKEYISDRGKRYEKCRLSNFRCQYDKQTAAVAMLNHYMDDMNKNIGNGKNLILFGPSGTGKDHLLTAMVRAAIGYLEFDDSRTFQDWRNVRWFDGPSLSARVREEFDKEGSIISELSRCWLLTLSDLVPPNGKLTDFQSDTIYRLVDYRYSRMLPTFVSINVRNRDELDAALGVAIADRLIDNAATISCDWPSYRKAKK